MKLILEKHQSVAKVSRDLGVSQNTLHQWKRFFIEDLKNCFPCNGYVTDYEAEMRRLKRELENEILLEKIQITYKNNRCVDYRKLSNNKRVKPLKFTLLYNYIGPSKRNK